MPAAVPMPPLQEAPPRSIDVERCCRLFLGREPDAALRAARWSGVPGLVRTILGAAEFKTSVLPPLLLRETLPHAALEPTPPYLLVDWAQDRLPLGSDTKRAIGTARTWPLLLEILLSDSILTGLVPDMTVAGIDRALRDRIASALPKGELRAVVGSIDSASAFEVRGWAVDICDKARPVNLEFYADAIFLGATEATEPRPDVMEVVGGSGNCGFVYKIAVAHRAGFSTGRTLTVVDAVTKQPIGPGTLVHADAARTWDSASAAYRELEQLRRTLERIEASLPDLHRVASLPVEAYDEYWRRFYRPTAPELRDQAHRSREFTYRPLISIVMPTWNSETRLLDKAIGSVRVQSYDEWELIIADDASTRGDELLRVLRRHAEADPRIRLVLGETPAGIAGNTNRGLAQATGEYVAFLDHDDELAPDALFEVVGALQSRRYELLYSDEDRIEEDELGRTVHHTPFFKSRFDPDLLLSMNYICHLVVVRRDLVVRLGGLRPRFDGAQDHDLLLRATAEIAPDAICHLPRILYHWRLVQGSVSESPERVEAIRGNIVSAVTEHLAQRGVAAEIAPHDDPVGAARQFATRVRWPLPDPAPRLSIIVPTRDRLDLLRPCIDSILESLPAYPGDVEILLVNNDSAEPETLAYFDQIASRPSVRVIGFRGAFNWSAINNAAVSEARGDIVVFLNNDTVVLSRDWCAELASHALRPDVGAVGARLLFADGTIQHAGVVLGVEGVAGHEAIGDSPAQGGYFGRSHLLRSCDAVTGACLATRRDLFQKLGGFDELNLKVAFNDVDYCLKVREAGYRVVYNPFATLYHFESKSRGRELSPTQQARHRFEATVFNARWSRQMQEESYYNPHFERYARAYDRLRPPPGSVLNNGGSGVE